MTTEIATDLLGKRVSVLFKNLDIDDAGWTPKARGIVRGVSNRDGHLRFLIAIESEYTPGYPPISWTRGLPNNALVVFGLGLGVYTGYECAIVPLDVPLDENRPTEP